MLFAALLVVLAVTARAADVRMEPSVNVFSSSNWLKEKVINENDIIKTSFVLKHDPVAMEAFEKTVLDLSNPKSKNYAKWLTVRHLTLILKYLFQLKILFPYAVSLPISSRRSRPVSRLPPLT